MGIQPVLGRGGGGGCQHHMSSRKLIIVKGKRRDLWFLYQNKKGAMMLRHSQERMDLREKQRSEMADLYQEYAIDRANIEEETDV
jgi:hypothetical protein